MWDIGKVCVDGRVWILIRKGETKTRANPISGFPRSELKTH